MVVPSQLVAQFLTWRESVYRILNDASMVFFVGLRDRISNRLADVYDRVTIAVHLDSDSAAAIESVVMYLRVLQLSGAHFFDAPGGAGDAAQAVRQVAAEVQLAARDHAL